MTYDQKIKALISLSCNEELTKFYKLQANKVMLGILSSADSITAINAELDKYKGDKEGMPAWFNNSIAYLNDKPAPDAYKFEPNSQE